MEILYNEKKRVYWVDCRAGAVFRVKKEGAIHANIEGLPQWQAADYVSMCARSFGAVLLTGLLMRW
jgi:hypothetical protein